MILMTDVWGNSLMANAKKPAPIRLSNRTAIGLRKTARRVRGAWLIAMGVFAMLATVAAVYMGFSWLPAVPLTLLGAGVIVALMMLISRSQYLLLISQAICTEAASRQMEESSNEQKRRRKAIEQLAAMRADVREAQTRGRQREERQSEESVLFDLLTGRDVSEEEIRRQRRSEEDEEMYAASYQGEEPDEQADLYPPKKEKKQKHQSEAADMQTGSTRIVKSREAEKPLAQAEEQADAPRRRRRKAAAQTAPLQLIRGDQAQ